MSEDDAQGDGPHSPTGHPVETGAPAASTTEPDRPKRRRRRCRRRPVDGEPRPRRRRRPAESQRLEAVRAEAPPVAVASSEAASSAFAPAPPAQQPPPHDEAIADPITADSVGAEAASTDRGSADRGSAEAVGVEASNADSAEVAPPAGAAVVGGSVAAYSAALDSLAEASVEPSAVRERFVEAAPGGSHSGELDANHSVDEPLSIPASTAPPAALLAPVAEDWRSAEPSRRRPRATGGQPRAAGRQPRRDPSQRAGAFRRIQGAPARTPTPLPVAPLPVAPPSVGPSEPVDDVTSDEPSPATHVAPRGPVYSVGGDYPRDAAQPISEPAPSSPRMAMSSSLAPADVPAPIPASQRLIAPQPSRQVYRSHSDDPRGTDPHHPAMLDPRADASVSPRMSALFGGLFGVATIASIVALLIQVFPVQNDRAIVARMPTAVSSSVPVVAPAVTVERPKRQRKLLPSPWRISELKGSHRLVSGTMKRRSFISALAEAGVPKGEIYRLIKSMEGVRSFDRTGRKHRFTVALDRATKQAAAFEYEVDSTEIYQARTGKDGLLRGARLDMKVAEEEFVTAFYIGKDLTKSYRRVGLEPGLERVLNKAYSGRTSTEAFEEGGVVRLVVVEKTALGRFVGYARIKAVEYRPPDPSKKPKRAYWFDKARTYVDGRGRRPSHKGWRKPVPGAPITSHFNPNRMHPVLKRKMPHNGTDFGAPAGTPVYAAFRGEVTWVGMHGASGNLVSIEHPGNIRTGYAHLSRFAKGLKTGDRVGTRQLIGYIGTTGRSTGPHLHFSAKRNGKFFDSRELKLDAVQLLPVADRGIFLQDRKRLDVALERIPLPAPPPPEPPPPPPEPEPEPEQEQAEPDRRAESPPPERDPQPREEPRNAPPPEPAGGSSDDGEQLLGDDLSGDME